MYILSLDTTAKTASVCVSEMRDGALFPCTINTYNCGFTHSETLLPMIDACVKNAGLDIESISVIAVSAGPGSFTGVRIGVACAKGISFALSSKGIEHECIAVSAPEALAHNINSCSGYILCPVMDARRSQFYNALFKTGRSGEIKRLCEDRLISARELYTELSEKYSGKKVLFVGDGALLAKKLFDEIVETDGKKAYFNYSICDSADMFQNAYSVAKVACLTKNGKKTSGAELSPIYLRASQAERERLEKEADKKRAERI